MNCPRCGKENQSDARFCMNCGLSLTRACTNCATVLPLAARFCSNCGQPQNPPTYSDSQTAESGEDLTEPFSPQALIARLDAARSAGDAHVGDGERRIITMLFCDVKGSTAAASRLDPEEWSEIINGGFERMIRPIYDYDGTVARLMGDGLLAFFGAPAAHEDDPQRAILAGLAIVNGVRLYAEEVRRRWEIHFNVRVGINTGEVVVGVVGSGQFTEYTAIGDAINLAARMEQTAEPGTVQIGADTHRLVAPLFDLEDLGGVIVKGLDEPVAAWRVLGRLAQPGRLRGIAGLESPLVGRERETGQIAQRLDAWKEGRGGILFLTGEAGLGKSRLIAETRQRAGVLMPDHEWLEGASLSYETGQPYGLVQRLFRRLCGVTAGDDPGHLQEQLTAEVKRTLGEGDQGTAALEVLSQMLLGETGGDRPQLEGEMFRNRLRETIVLFWRQRSAVNPVILVLDDLHWTDAASVDLLCTLFDITPEYPLLWIGALRPDRQSVGWTALESARTNMAALLTEVAVGPLSLDQSGDLVQGLFKQIAWPAAMQQRVLEKAGGNPFFVEELIRSLVESGAIVHKADGRWAVDPNTADIDLPDTLQGLLRARIDRLEAGARDTLQMASVIGRSFYYRVLSELSRAAARLERNVDDLTEADMIREITQSHELEYMFTHALTQQAAYHSILLRKRRDYHQRVGKALEKLFTSRLEELAPILAQHFELAGDTDKAGHYYTIAGDMAFHVYAITEAAEHYRHALELALRSKVEDVATVAHLFARRGRTLELLAQYKEALELYEEMETWAASAGQTDVVLESLLTRITVRATAHPYHDADDAQRLLARARALSAESGGPASEARILWNMLLLATISGIEFSDVNELLEGGLAISRAAGLKEQEALLLFDGWYYFGMTGQWQRGREYLTLALDLWRDLGNMPLLSETYGRLGYTEWFLGEYDLALAHSADGERIARESNNGEALSVSLSVIAPVLFDRGELQPALNSMEEATTVGHAVGGITAVGNTQAEWGFARVWLGDPPNEGLALTEQALDWVEQRMSQVNGFALVPLARIHLLLGNLAEARAAQERLKSVRFQQQTAGFIPHVWIGCGLVGSELALRQGQAAESLAIAQATITDMQRDGLRYLLPDLQLLAAEALIELGRPDETVSALAVAEQTAVAIGSRRILWEIYAVQAVMAAASDDPDSAERCRQQAWQVVEAMASTLDSPDRRESFRQQVVARRPVLAQPKTISEKQQEA